MTGKTQIRKVVFMGTPDFAVGTLQALIASDYEVTAVYTQPDKPKGRGEKMQMTPVKECAAEAGIPVYQPLSLRAQEAVEELRALEPDVIVVAAYGQIISQEVLDIPPCGCINVHASLLPKYRGAAPIQWAILDGEKETGVTTMRMNAGLDTGDMIEKVIVPITDEETGGSLFDKLSAAGAELLLQTLKAIEDGSAVYTPQPEESTTHYASMLKKSMGQIDWKKSAAEIERMIRGLSPWPSAYTSMDGKQLKVWQSKVTGEGASGKEPGTVLAGDGKSIRVQTGDGILEITRLQLAGKKQMDADAFLRGVRLADDTVLGE